VYISPPVFITVNENTKQISDWCYDNRNTNSTELSMSIARAVIAIKDKQ
jgi:hypothetical protein